MVNQSDIDFLHRLGKCASVEAKGGFLCTLFANHYGRNHKAQILGGPEDGKVLAEWPW